MRVCITGGAGFIGSALGKHLLDNGHEVALIDNFRHGKAIEWAVNKERARIYPLDITEAWLPLYMEDWDVLYHFASVSNLALCQSDPLYAYNVNVNGTLHILEQARRVGVKRVVFASTSAVYENSSGFPSYEYDPIQPDLIYSMSKKAGEDICRSYVSNYGMDMSILRFFNTYGPGQDHERDNPPLIPTLCHSLFSGNPITIYGDGEQRRDYVYIDDVVDACISVGQAEDLCRGEAFNIASNKTASPKMLADILTKEFGGVLPVVYETAETMWNNRTDLFEGYHSINPKRVSKECNKFTWGSLNKTKALLNWEPETSIEEGVLLTAKAIKEKYYGGG